MKYLHRLLAAAFLAAFFIVGPAAAQWQVPDHSVPIGRGAGTGFKFAAPSTAGGVLTSKSASSDPAFIAQNGGLNAVAFGADPTGVADSTSAVNAMLAALPSGCGAVYFPAGKYKLNSRIVHTLSATICAFSLRGDGPDVTILHWPNATGGWKIQLANKQNSAHVSDLAFTTARTPVQDDGGTGLEINQSDYLGAFPQSDITNVHARGDAVLAQRWNTGVLVHGLSSVNYTKVNVWGSGSYATATGTCIKIEGDAVAPGFSIAHNLSKVFCGNIGYGVYMGTYTQGINITQSYIGNALYGVYQPAAAFGQAQVSLTDTLIEANAVGVTLTGGTGFAAKGNFILTDGIAYDIQSWTDFSIIGDELGGVHGTSIGIKVTAAAQGGSIIGNKIIGFGTGISLGASATTVNAKGNVYTGNTTDFTDAGTSNQNDSTFNKTIKLIGANTSGLDLSAATGLSSSILLPNNSQIVQKDSGGTFRNIISVTNLDQVIIANAAFGTTYLTSPLTLVSGDLLGDTNTRKLGLSTNKWLEVHYLTGKIYGSSSGVITAQAQAAAGTYNWNWPTTAGTSGQALLSGGGSSTAMTFGTLGVGAGGTGLTAGTSGGIPYFSSASTIASSAALTANAIVKGGGAGVAPIASGVSIDSSNNISGIVGLTMTGSFFASSSSSFSPNNIVSNSANDGSAGSLVFWKSRSGGVVLSGDQIGGYAWAGHDGTQVIYAAQILATVDGTPGTNDMPGALTFYTTPDGSAALTEALKIDNSQRLRFAAASVVANGSVATTMTSLGPVGSHTTIQEWLVVKNAGGTLRYIPMY